MPYGYAVSVLVVLIAAVVLVRAVRFRPPVRANAPEPLPMPPDAMAVAEKMAAAVRIPTISTHPDHPERTDAMLAYHAEMERLFPRVHGAMERTVVNGLSLVYRWPGKSSKEPVCVMAHMDVVPVESGTEQDWKHGPFSGDIADGFVWGRGTLDIKSHMICALEAAEWLLAEGFTPARDIWFAFGHDEEAGGHDGASRMVAWFREKGVHFAYVLDEGGLVSEGAVKGIDRPLALIGVCEKGYADIRFTACDEGGHASMPPRHSALGLVSTFFHRLERRPMKARLIPLVRTFLDAVGREMSFGMRVILANLWLFKPLFMVVFSAGRTGNAMLRTTAAPTMAQASNAANVLPQKAEGVANFRLLPGDTGDTLMAHLGKVAKGLGMTMEAIQLNNPSGISSTDHPAWRRIVEGAGRLYPDAIAVPYLMMGATDSRKYEPVSDNQYRFTPYHIGTEDIRRIHGTNERISVDNLNRCVAFFRYMMEG